ncbi:hypothetical protein [Polyangium sorediatum]|uniref:Tryptophan synthase alpha chain n=1 Tax=Polyangium sorediatum TaxID=889274 RepID=A0ABT6NYY2_9BACT|nr:hypothetical protein [Polyangium sorediatum]MDI1433524.1 hypothetical protein [Polyangium sorediatum]
MAWGRRLGGLVLTAMVVWAGGCLDLEANVPGECTAGQTDPTTPDDCIRKECQGGKLVVVPSDTETPDDANPCTQDTCTEGAPQHTAVDGTTCQVGTSMGECVAGQCEIPCATSEECDDENRCTVDSCVGQVCMFAASGDADPDDMYPCTVDACEGGKESHTPANGAPCGTNGTCNDMGVCIGCGSDGDCPSDDFCSDWACTEKQCVATPRNEGSALPPSDQTTGNCKTKVCHGGLVETIVDATDPFNDGNTCTADQCNEMAPVNPPLASQSPCATPNNPTGMGKCDGAGVCIGCSQASDCVAVASTCNNGVCVSCFDGVKNGGEGDVDCGGICQLKCATSSTCNVGADCSSGVCTDGKCAVPTCSDAVQNGTESDVDCGGSCVKCAPGKSCLKNADCLDMVCTNGICG